jgi:hypothetical protein
MAYLDHDALDARHTAAASRVIEQIVDVDPQIRQLRPHRHAGGVANVPSPSR